MVVSEFEIFWKIPHKFEKNSGKIREIQINSNKIVEILKKPQEGHKNQVKSGNVRFSIGEGMGIQGERFGDSRRMPCCE